MECQLIILRFVNLRRPETYRQGRSRIVITSARVDIQDVIRQRVQALLNARGLDQRDFARLMDRTQGWASMFLSGQRRGGVALAEEIADKFGVPLISLITPPPSADDDVEDETIDVSGYTKNAIPVIAEGDATPQPGLFWETDGSLKSEVEDRLTRPRDVNDPRAYGVTVRGDSMMPRFKPGDVLVVSPNIAAADGDEVYVQLLSGERLIKVARKVVGGWWLESYNPAHETRPVRRSEIGAMHPIVWIRPKRRGVHTVKERER